MKNYILIIARPVACLAMILVLFVGVARSQSIDAPTPRTISYQGVLRADDGAPVKDAAYHVTLHLYSDEAGTREVWHDTFATETHAGAFGILMGGGTSPLPAGDEMDRQLWLGIQIENGEELRPLTPLSSTAYALNVADKSVTEKKIAADYVKSITLNGQKLSGNAADLQIQTGDGILATVDPATNAVVLKGGQQSLAGAKGGTVEGNTTISGSLTVTGATFLGSSSSATNVYGQLNISKDIVPTTDNTLNIGSPSKRIANLYLGPGSLTMTSGTFTTDLEIVGGVSTWSVTSGGTTTTPLTMTTSGLITTGTQTITGPISSGSSITVDGSTTPRRITWDKDLIMFDSTPSTALAGGAVTLYAGTGGPGGGTNGGNLTLISGAQGSGGGAADGDIIFNTGGTWNGASGTTQMTVNHTGGITINNGNLSLGGSASATIPTIYGGSLANSNLSLLTTSNAAAPTGTITLGGSTGGGATTFATFSSSAVAIPNGQSILASGTAGTTPASGAGTRMEWIPAKAAFRAGYVNGSEWDDANIGSYSTAMGNSTRATGGQSTAMGSATLASGDNSFAMGIYSVASGTNSTAMGYETSASSTDAVAMGNATVASGPYSTAMGDHTTASNWNAVAMGYSTVASGIRSVAMGEGTIADNTDATAIGEGSHASGLESIAMGQETNASGSVATAMGTQTSASASNSTAMGVQTTASGQVSTAMGWLTTASGYRSTTMGHSTTASGENAVAMGVSSLASGTNSTAMGNSTTASGVDATAMGNSTTASGAQSTAIGYNASTNGMAASIAIGDGSAATVNDAANQFMARASNGFKLFDGSGATPSLTLASTNLSIVGDITSLGGNLKTGSTTRIDNSGNLPNTGNITFSGNTPTVTIPAGTNHSVTFQDNSSNALLTMNENASNQGDLSASGSVAAANNVVATSGAFKTGSTTRIANNGNATLGTIGAGATTLTVASHAVGLAIANSSDGNDITGSSWHVTSGGAITSTGLDAGSGTITTTGTMHEANLTLSPLTTSDAITIGSGSTGNDITGNSWQVAHSGAITSTGLDAGSGTITSSGAINTTGSGTITSAGLLTASNGLTVSSGDIKTGSTSRIDNSGNLPNTGDITFSGNTPTVTIPAGTNHSVTIADNAGSPNALFTINENASSKGDVTATGSITASNGDIIATSGAFKTGSTTRIANNGAATLAATSTTTLDVVGTANINNSGTAATNIGNTTGVTTLTGERVNSYIEDDATYDGTFNTVTLDNRSIVYLAAGGAGGSAFSSTADFNITVPNGQDGEQIIVIDNADNTSDPNLPLPNVIFKTAGGATISSFSVNTLPIKIELIHVNGAWMAF